jgi:undecaprenyl-diphosphatase
MTTWEAIILGLIQGITEFLPISSSGHLELGQLLLGFEDLHQYILFNLICHLGTLTSILYMLFPEIKKSLTTNRKMISQVIIGTLPLFPLVLILHPIKKIFNQPQYLGICFLFSAFLLFSGISYQLKKEKKLKTFKWLDALAIGVFQSIAVLPGVSRSGATISAARLLGWQKEEAFHFSFLLAIPAILGGTILELLEWIRTPSSEVFSIHLFPFIVGFMTSFAIGCLSLRLLIRLLARDQWVYFGWYCLFLGITTSLYFNIFI